MRRNRKINAAIPPPNVRLKAALERDVDEKLAITVQGSYDHYVKHQSAACQSPFACQCLSKQKQKKLYVWRSATLGLFIKFNIISSAKSISSAHYTTAFCKTGYA